MREGSICAWQLCLHCDWAHVGVEGGPATQLSCHNETLLSAPPPGEHLHT